MVFAKFSSISCLSNRAFIDFLGSTTYPSYNNIFSSHILYESTELIKKKRKMFTLSISVFQTVPILTVVLLGKITLLKPKT